MQENLKFTEQLSKIGLNPNEAIVYETLIIKGEKSASNLKRSLPAQISRPMLYFILEKLVNLDLVIKNEVSGKAATFTAAHPQKLQDLLDKKEEEIRQNKSEFALTLGNIVSEYNLNIGKPGIASYEGLTGIQKLYEQINRDKLDILLIRSPLDNYNPELDKLVLDQIDRQSRLKIKVKAITPIMSNTKKTIETLDKDRLVERKLLDINLLNIPSQIIIFGNKVGITSYDRHLVTTIIDNQAVSQTMKILFDFMWNSIK